MSNNLKLKKKGRKDMNSTLSSAIYKAQKYDAFLNQNEYNELMKWAKISCSEGREACKALATAKSYSYRQFRNVWHRNRSEENKYAALSSPVGSGGFCYLTTACLSVYKNDFKDNCYELEKLRKFRDSFVKQYHPYDIVRYYEISPKIVEIIDRLPHNKDIYNDIYNELVKKTVRLIENNQLDTAYTTYKNYSLDLEKKFLL